MTEIIKLAVPVGTGCKQCMYFDEEVVLSNCAHPRVDADCHRRESTDSTGYTYNYEYIYVSPEKAALMRLRGELV